MYKHYMDNNEDADFKDPYICILIAKTNIRLSSFSDICVIKIDILFVHLHSYYSTLNV